mmetsp:Transcript_3477/g.12660  ORF Transcript_3477/g.12660 Transcript_3477/m.12660 type:complete len:860 (+) Transcript_3477:596-3175(+)
MRLLVRLAVVRAPRPARVLLRPRPRQVLLHRQRAHQRLAHRIRLGLVDVQLERLGHEGGLHLPPADVAQVRRLHRRRDGRRRAHVVAVPRRMAASTRAGPPNPAGMAARLAARHAAAAGAGATSRHRAVSSQPRNHVVALALTAQGGRAGSGRGRGAVVGGAGTETARVVLTAAAVGVDGGVDGQHDVAEGHDGLHLERRRHHVERLGGLRRVLPRHQLRRRLGGFVLLPSPLPALREHLRRPHRMRVLRQPLHDALQMAGRSDAARLHGLRVEALRLQRARVAHRRAVHLLHVLHLVHQLAPVLQLQRRRVAARARLLGDARRRLAVAILVPAILVDLAHRRPDVGTRLGCLLGQLAHQQCAARQLLAAAVARPHGGRRAQGVLELREVLQQRSQVGARQAEQLAVGLGAHARVAPRAVQHLHLPEERARLEFSESEAVVVDEGHDAVLDEVHLLRRVARNQHVLALQHQRRLQHLHHHRLEAVAAERQHRHLLEDILVQQKRELAAQRGRQILHDGAFVHEGRVPQHVLVVLKRALAQLLGYAPVLQELVGGRLPALVLLDLHAHALAELAHLADDEAEEAGAHDDEEHGEQALQIRVRAHVAVSDGRQRRERPVQRGRVSCPQRRPVLAHVVEIDPARVLDVLYRRNVVPHARGAVRDDVDRHQQLEQHHRVVPPVAHRQPLHHDLLGAVEPPGREAAQQPYQPQPRIAAGDRVPRKRDEAVEHEMPCQVRLCDLLRVHDQVAVVLQHRAEGRQDVEDQDGGYKVVHDFAERVHLHAHRVLKRNEVRRAQDDPQQRPQVRRLPHLLLQVGRVEHPVHGVADHRPLPRFCSGCDEEVARCGASRRRRARRGRRQRPH